MTATEKVRQQEPFLTTLQRKWCKTCVRLWKTGSDCECQAAEGAIARFVECLPATPSHARRVVVKQRRQ